MRRVSATLVIAALVASACTSSNDQTGEPPEKRDLFADAPVATDSVPPTEPATSVLPAETAAPEPADFGIAWEKLGSRTDGGWLTVPVDYSDPGAGTIDLWVVRHRANDEDRIGSLFSNNGGPGAAGSTIAQNATAWFPSDLTDRFDIVSWDPRGTGISDGAVDCISDEQYDEFFGAADVTPDDDAERQQLIDLARRFAEGCVERVGDVLPHLGTNNSARDIDAIRQALGEEQISYFGFSYGSELGGVWATLFPDTVRAAVFDGASDPNADPLEHQRQQWIGFEAALNTFLAECSADSSCVFHNDGDAEAAFDQLLAGLDEQPIAAGDGRVPVNQGVAITAVVQSMYSDRFWPALERSLEDALAGDGEGLLSLNDAYYQRGPGGDYSNLLEAFQVITCADTDLRQSIAESDADAEQLIGVAPRLFPYTTGSYFCTFFPEPADPRIDITGEGAGPIVVIGTTGDPSTPLESSANMAAALEDGRLLVVEANQHTGYSASTCAQDVVHDYLIWLQAPDDGTVCSA